MKFSGNRFRRSKPPASPVPVDELFRKFARDAASPLAIHWLVVANCRSASEPLPFCPTVIDQIRMPLSIASNKGASRPARVRLNASRIPFSKILIVLSSLADRSLVPLLPT